MVLAKVFIVDFIVERSEGMLKYILINNIDEKLI